MATMILGAAGSAIGGALGGSVAGLTSIALGKAAGATLGSALDKRLLGLGAEPVETGRVDRFRVMGAGEGAAVARTFGRMRVPGQIIWSSRFLEHVNTQTVGGKGGGQQTREFTYSISLAIALCEGEVSRIGRIWADGEPVSQLGLTWRLHRGDENQLPDPLIAAIEGEANTPAYRGTAYVVFENLDLSPYGNRIPQFNFEVFRRFDEALPKVARHPALDIQGVALVPETGEYSLGTEPVYFEHDKGNSEAVNVHNDEGKADLVASLGQMNDELPNAKSVSLVVSWFGDDLQCGQCSLKPAVEQNQADATMPWKVSGTSRFEAKVVNYLDDRPLFGGTPTDASVLQALRYMKSNGHSVMFYPFILMDILAGNGLGDPWSERADQAAVPWRGRITLAKAPGQPGSTDKTPASASEVDMFFGRAKPSDFRNSGDAVEYTGPREWSYRRFILHYAHLCALAGGVESFCIGSEMRGLTQIRDGADTYPAVRALARLASDVRSVLGPDCRIGYAADWSEYFGHQPTDGSGDVIYHLDPLWASDDIDYIGIDNYMPLSDWRDGEHADIAARSVYDLEYLTRNVAGGEGFDWYYADAAGRASQDRRPIVDGAYGEDWVFRYKDILSWWSEPHFDRLSGIKKDNKTNWIPKSKPIRFTELGCPAVDNGTNQPNVFHDPKSSESFFPYFSNGSRDDFIQYRYLQAIYRYWNDPANNPVSQIYGERMVDMAHAHVWAWDARPWPDFPNRDQTWADGENYARGHWLNGRASLCGLDGVVAEICVRAGFHDYDVRALHGGVTGYAVDGTQSGRQSLQPLVLAYGFDGADVAGELRFANRSGRRSFQWELGDLVANQGQPTTKTTRSASGEATARVLLGFTGADNDYQASVAEAVFPDLPNGGKSETGLGLVLSDAQAQATADRWLSESRISGETIEFGLPPSQIALTSTDIVQIRTPEGMANFRVDRIEDSLARNISAARIEIETYSISVLGKSSKKSINIIAESPVFAEFLDLPLLSGDENVNAPHIAVVKTPWRGPVAVYSSSSDSGYALNTTISRPATFGSTKTPLARGIPGFAMRSSLLVRLASGRLQTRSREDVLNGANVAALRFGGQGDWEIVQFEKAELIGNREYRLSEFLRGQAGTDAVVPEEWPVGTTFVLIDTAVMQISLAASARGLERHYRIGPLNRSYDDPSYIHQVVAFSGVGLRPYSPVHLTGERKSDGSIAFRWIRRTRIDGDNWAGPDVPLGEGREAYHFRIVSGERIIRDGLIDNTEKIYSSREQSEDGDIFPIDFEVAQLSDRYGAGPYTRIEFHG